MHRSDPPELPDFAPQPEMSDALDATVVTLPCYEPSGHCIEISGRTLVTHTLLSGQTGSGKTSVLRRFLKELIHHQSGDSGKKPGIFIFDLNGDDTVDLVRTWAHEAGRLDDLQLLTPNAGYLDLFSHVRTLEDLSSATAQIMNGQWYRDTDNGYWAETCRCLIDAALSVCLIVQGRLDTDVAIQFMTNWLVAKRPSAPEEALLSQFETMVSLGGQYLDKTLLGKLEHVRATVETWNKLDGKTRSILASCLLNALGPLISLDTRPYLDSSRGACFHPEDITQGRILILSLSAARNREAASLLARLIKSRLYVSLQERSQDRNQRICAVISDEYHYLASGGVERSSDVVALATLRSRSVAVIAATQSFDHLAAVMGRQDFQSLIPNFGNHVFFRSTESATATLATSVMGRRAMDSPSDEPNGDLILGSPPERPTDWVCPPGALSQLEPCQAYVAFSNGYRSPGVVWLAGQYDKPSPPRGSYLKKRPVTDPLKKLREATAKPSAVGIASSSISFPPAPSRDIETSAQDTTLYYSFEVWSQLLKQRRFQATPFLSFQSFCQAFSTQGHKPMGLETLPPCWWNPLIKLTVSFCYEHPMKLIGLHQVEGCLTVALSGTSVPAETYFDWIISLEKSLYPIRTRKLKKRDLWALGQG